MSDPIWGLLIHNFVDEGRTEKEKVFDQVKYELWVMGILPYDSRLLSFGSLEEKMYKEGKGG